MRKLALLSALALMVSASTVFALPLVNGDFDDPVSENGWTRWRAPWGTNEVWSDPAGPSSGDLGLSGNGSFGWWQRVPVIPSEIYTLQGEWAGDVGGAGWAEVMVFTSTEGLTDSDIASRVDTGAAADIAIKKDSWGLNPPTAWGWEDVNNSKYDESPNPPPFEIHMTCAEAVIALKLGSVEGGGSQWVSYDNLELVPEPAAALLLGLPMLLIRRRR